MTKDVELGSTFKRKVIAYTKYEEMKTDLKDIADELRDAPWETWFHKSQTISMQRSTAYLITNYIGFLEQELDHLSQLVQEHHLQESDRPLFTKRVFAAHTRENREPQTDDGQSNGQRRTTI